MGGGESGTEIRGVTGDGRARWNFSYLVGGEYHARRQQFAVRRRKALRFLEGVHENRVFVQRDSENTGRGGPYLREREHHARMNPMVYY